MLHGNCDGTAGSKNRDAFTAAAGREDFPRPEFTREQNSSQVSTPGGQIAPRTHLPMTASNSF